MVMLCCLLFVPDGGLVDRVVATAPAAPLARAAAVAPLQGSIGTRPCCLWPRSGSTTILSPGEQRRVWSRGRSIDTRTSSDHHLTDLQCGPRRFLDGHLVLGSRGGR